MKIVINRIISQTAVEGPGKRFCIFLQGCTIQCMGCANEEMWALADGKTVDIQEIYEQIEAESKNIEGITFLGGEPTEQADAVSDIAKFAHDLGLSVVTFTGYRYEELLKKNRGGRSVDY